jgi:GTP cyclohydrolase I
MEIGLEFPIWDPEVEIAKHIHAILKLIGEDPERDGLQDTPSRVARAYGELFSSYGDDPDHLFTTFDGDSYGSMVITKDIPFTSFCEHHILPFMGVAHVGYIPEGNRIIGLSKIARLVDFYARRLQVQERMTDQIADKLNDKLLPKGVMVVLEAEHSCMSIRGVSKVGTTTITSAIRGVFEDTSREARTEFLRLIGK